MQFTLKQIAALINAEVRGDENELINRACKIQEGEKGGIAFLANPKYEPYIYDTAASAVIVNKSFVARYSIKTTLLVVDDAYTAFSILLDEYRRMFALNQIGIEQPCFIAESAKVGTDVYIGAFAYIATNTVIGNNTKIYPQAYIGDNVKIGKNCVIYSGVKIYNGTVIGDYCTVHSGTVLGSDGFGFAPQSDGSYKPVPQVGNVVIGNHVDIGANTTIDRATIGSTIIEDGVKLDNLIQIAHNVKIGKNTVIAAQAGISGSTNIGENCIFGGQVGVVGHLSIPSKTTIAAQSGVMKPPHKQGETLLGSPAFEHREYLKTYTVFRKLPELQRRIEQLEDNVFKKNNG